MQENYDLDTSDFIRRRIISLVGTKWRAFKTMLSSLYVFRKYKEKSPCEMYGINEQTWESFVQSRLDPSSEVYFIIHTSNIKYM